MKRCIQCQNDLPDPAAHCVHCGARQPPVATAAPGARTVMGYPGMANDVARQSGAPAAGGKPGRANVVSGYDATQPLPNDRFRGGPPPGEGGFGPQGPQPGPGGAPDRQRGGQGYGPPGMSAGPSPANPYPGAGPGYGSPPGPGPGFGPPPGDQGFGPPQGGYGARQGSQPQGFGPPPGDQGYGARPGSQPQGFGPPPGDQYGARPGSQPQGFGPPPGDQYGARPGSQPQGFGPPPGDQYGARPGSQPQGFGPPPGDQGYGARPGSQPQGFGPPPQGYGGPQGFGPPPAGSGFAPVQGQGHGPGHPPPHAYGAPPPMGFHQQRPETELVAPLRPPYLASETGRRASSPMEPWAESLKTLMLVFGVLLVACFVAPWQVQPGATTFSWSILSSEASVAAKAIPILFVATGALAILLGALPLSTLARGFAAAGIGLAPIVYQAVAPAFDWRNLITLIGAVTLVAGLLVRSQYTGAMAGRLMATIGAICTLLPLLISVGGAVPLVEMFKALGQGTGQMKVATIITLVPVVLAVLAFLVWLPPPGRAGAHILAWLLIVWPLVASIAMWLLGGDLGANLKGGLHLILYLPMAGMAWAGLTGYGVATVTGKQLEHA